MITLVLIVCLTARSGVETCTPYAFTYGVQEITPHQCLEQATIEGVKIFESHSEESPRIERFGCVRNKAE